LACTPKQKVTDSVRAHSAADESYLFSFFLLPRLQIVVDESGNPEYNFWLKSNCLLAFE
jgi:hypothetical protein